MSTVVPTVPYRLEFAVEVPGTPEQVWHALATAAGLSAWFLPTDLEEHEGGALHFSMGPDMGSDGHVTAWEPPRRLVYEEDWAALMGQDPSVLSPLTSEFVVEARSGGTCVVRVTSSGFGTGAAWESDFWADMGASWEPQFENLRLYVAHFAGRSATVLEASAAHAAETDALWSALRAALGAGEGGTTIDVRGVTGVLQRVEGRQAFVLLAGPVEGMLHASVHAMGEDESLASVRLFLFSPDAEAYVAREQPAWEAWLGELGPTA